MNKIVILNSGRLSGRTLAIVLNAYFKANGEELIMCCQTVQEATERMKDLANSISHTTDSFHNLLELIKEEKIIPPRSVIPDRFKNNIHLRKAVRNRK